MLAEMLAALVALLLMPMQPGLPLKTMFAAVLGVGFAAANTVANMFIVEVRPPDEWDNRIGALQALSSLGQVVGLLLAGLIGGSSIGGRYAIAYGVAAALVAASVPMAWLTLRNVHVSARCSGGAPAARRGGVGRLATADVPHSHLAGTSDAAARTRYAVRASDDRVVRGAPRDHRRARYVAAGAHPGVGRVDASARPTPSPPLPVWRCIRW